MESSLLFLLSIIPCIIAIMVRQVELTIAAIGATGTLISIIQAIQPNASVVWLWSSLLCSIAFIGALGDSVRNAIKVNLRNSWEDI